MGNQYDYNACRNLVFAIAISAYGELVDSYRELYLAQERGLTKDIKAAEDAVERAASWFDGIEWQKKAIEKAKIDGKKNAMSSKVRRYYRPEKRTK